ncbi:unnamed protein product [Bathycoccus prasinos]
MSESEDEEEEGAKGAFEEGKGGVFDFFFGNIRESLIMIGGGQNNNAKMMSAKGTNDNNDGSSLPRGSSDDASNNSSSSNNTTNNNAAAAFRRRGNAATMMTTFGGEGSNSSKFGYEEELFGTASGGSPTKQFGHPDGNTNTNDNHYNASSGSISMPSTPNGGGFANNNNNRTNSVNQATVNLINGILGTGALGLPYCFKLTGVFLTTMLIVVSACSTMFTTQCLLFSSAVTDAWSYEEVAFRTLGNRGKILVRICVVALLMGCSVAYVNIVSDIFSGVAGTIVPAGAEPSRGETMVAVVCFGFVPIGTMIRSAKALSSTSAFGIFIAWMFTLSVAVVYFFKSSVYPDLYAEHELAGNNAVQTWNSEKIMIVLPVLSFGFAASPIMYPVVQTLKDPTNNRVLSVANKSIWISGIAYFIIGLMGYLTFQDSASGDVLRNFGAEKGSWGVLMRTMKLLYCVSMATCVPVVFITLRETLTPVVLRVCQSPESQKEMSRGQDIGLNAVLFGSSLAMAFYIPNVEFVFGLVGATSCSTLIFTAPSLIFLSATSDSSGSYAKASSKVSSFGWITTLGLTTSRQIARLFCAFGVYLLVKSTEHTIRAVHEEQTLVDLVSSLHAAEAKASEAAVMYEKVYEAADKFQRVEKAESELSIAQTESEKTMQIVKDAVASLEKLSSKSDGGSSSSDFKNMFFGDSDDDAQGEVLKKSIEEVSEMSKSFGNVTIGSLIEAEATLEELSDEISDEKNEIEKEKNKEQERRDKDAALIAEATGTVVDFESIKESSSKNSESGKDGEKEEKEVEKLVADESETVKRVFETQSALSVLHDVATEVIGAMDVSHAGVSSASARAQSRLHEVQNVLNTTQMTAEVISKTLADLKEAKETQSENVLKAVMKAIENSGRNDEEGKDLMEALAQVENEARELAERRKEDEDEDEDKGSVPREETKQKKDTYSSDSTGDGISDETVAKLLDATKTAAEKMVVTEVEDIMKKTSKVKPEVVDRAAEIARQLRPKAVEESSEKPSINSLFDISNQKDKTTSGGDASQGGGGGEAGNEAASLDAGNATTAAHARALPDLTYEERKKEWKIKPLLDSEFFERAGKSKANSNNKEEAEELAAAVEASEEAKDDDDDGDLNWDSSFSKRVRSSSSSGSSSSNEGDALFEKNF